MRKSTEKNLKILRRALLFALATGLAVLLVTRPDTTSSAVQDALSLCAKSVIPSLFPFLVLSAFITESGLAVSLGKFLAPVTRSIFNLPGVAGSAIIMGLIGGFPVGPKMTTHMYKNGLISQKQAQYMCMFTINAGPAFVMGTVGYAMLGNVKAGLLIYLSMIFSSLFFGIALCRRLKNSQDKSENTADNPIGEALCKSVNKGTDSMINICAFVVIFAAFTSGLELFISNSYISNALAILSEITKGSYIISLAKTATLHKLPLLSAALSFCGFCVHAQIQDCLRATGLSYFKFLISRLCCACLSFLFCRTALFLFPENYQVFSNMSSALNIDVSMSFFACVSVILMSMLLIFDLDIPRELC